MAIYQLPQEEKVGRQAYMVIIYLDALRFGNALEFPSLVKLGEIGFLAHCNVIPVTHSFCQDE